MAWVLGALALPVPLARGHALTLPYSLVVVGAVVTQQVVRLETVVLAPLVK